MAEMVCLNEVPHYSAIMKGLNEMRNDKIFCDFTIKVGDDEYCAHRNVLSAASEYFKAMMKSNTKESQLGVVVMKNMDSQCFKSCIDFIYTAKFAIPKGKSGDLLYSAKLMQLDKVSSVVIEKLEKSLDVSNFFATRQIANLFDLHDLESKCISFESDNLMLISAEPEFQKELKSHIINIIKSKKLALNWEEKLHIVINWTGYDQTKKKDLLDLLKLIDLNEVSNKYLKSLLGNDHLISTDFDLYKLLSEPIMKQNLLLENPRDFEEVEAVHDFEEDDTGSDIDEEEITDDESISEIEKEVCSKRVSPSDNKVSGNIITSSASFPTTSVNTSISILGTNDPVGQRIPQAMTVTKAYHPQPIMHLVSNITRPHNVGSYPYQHQLYPGISQAWRNNLPSNAPPVLQPQSGATNLHQANAPKIPERERQLIRIVDPVTMHDITADIVKSSESISTAPGSSKSMAQSKGNDADGMTSAAEQSKLNPFAPTYHPSLHCNASNGTITLKRNERQKESYDGANSPQNEKEMEILRKFGTLLQTVAQKNFSKVMENVLAFKISNERTLRGIVNLIFDKAIHDPVNSELYANMSRKMTSIFVTAEKKPEDPTCNTPVFFRKLLLSRCQQQFDKSKSSKIRILDLEKEVRTKKNQDSARHLAKELEKAKSDERIQTLGNIRFVGELFKLHMLTEEIMHHCILRLLQENDDYGYETLCELLITVGRYLDNPKGKPRMDQYFGRIEKATREPKISVKVRNLLMYVTNLRKNNWIHSAGASRPSTDYQCQSNCVKLARPLRPSTAHMYIPKK